MNTVLKTLKTLKNILIVILTPLVLLPVPLALGGKVGLFNSFRLKSSYSDGQLNSDSDIVCFIL